MLAGLAGRALHLVSDKRHKKRRRFGKAQSTQLQEATERNQTKVESAEKDGTAAEQEERRRQCRGVGRWQRTSG